MSGRKRKQERLHAACALAFALMLGLGAYLMFRGFGLALELAAVWLLLSTGLRALPPHYNEIA